jgi:hypothetical protein
MNRFVMATEEESKVDVLHPVTDNTPPPVVFEVPQATTVTDTPPVAMEPPTIPAIDALPQTPAPPPEPSLTVHDGPAPKAVSTVTDVDARGIPWDGRIHAGNKATTKDGNWKRRRGVSVEEVQRIEAELKGAYDTFGSSPRTVTTEATPAPPPPPAAAPGTEPPPATLDQVSHEAAKRNLGINALNALAAEVTNGQVGQVALLRDKPAYIQMLHDRVVQYPLATS